MTGVEILAANEVVVGTTCDWLAAGFCFLAIVVFGVIIGIFDDEYNRVLGALIGGLVGMLVGVLVWAIIVATTEKPIAYETQYKVTISDEVSMNDFLERYEIVDQEGKIYTVREIND